MWKYFIAIISLLTLNACKIYGLTDDFNKLNAEQQQKIVKADSFENVNQDKIYKINGSQLKAELKKHPKSLVYTFTNGCTSEYCLPMASYESFAKENGYTLFLVMEGFGQLEKTTVQRSDVFTAPLFAIDSDYYNKKYSGAYFKNFENDLLGQPANTKNKYQGSLYFFERDRLKRISRELPLKILNADSLY